MASQNKKTVDIYREDLARISRRRCTSQLEANTPPVRPSPAREALEIGETVRRPFKSKVWPGSIILKTAPAPKTPHGQEKTADGLMPSSEGGGETSKEKRKPSSTLLFLSSFGALFGIVAAFVLIGSPSTRLIALALAFFSGAIAVWRLLVDDLQRAFDDIQQKEERIRSLLDRCEDLEDKAWELRESDERQASILSTLGDIVIRRDQDDIVVYANAAAVDGFGSPDTALIGTPLSLPQASGLDTDQQATATRTDGGFGDLLLKTNNGPRWFSRIDVNVREPATDHPLIQTVLRDVTARRLIEDELLAARHQAENSSEAKSRFLATVSHEIRTPLNGILGMATLLRDTRLTKEQTAYINALETSGQTLLLLIDEVLDFSKVEAGKLEIQASVTPLADLVENVVELLAPKAHAKGLEIGTCIAPHLPEHVTLDATRVRQILFNLTGNGIKFTDDGGVAIKIDGRSGMQNGSLLDIAVQDTGIGFSEQEANRLFEEFEQIDHGPARKFGGTGLGLAIAQRLAGLMGGSIKATPGDQKGAIFQLSLPIPEPCQASETQAQSLLSGKIIAMVTKGQIEAPLLAERLRSEGAQVLLFQPGAADLTDMLPQSDLLIMDNAAVPDSGGWLASARLAGLTAPAVITVAPSERERLDRLRKAGFSAYMIRPVRMETLLHVTTGLLDDSTSGAPSWDIVTPKPATGLKDAPAFGRPLRLLVAEDNDINRLLSDALLRKLGHEPVLVADGEAAVEAAAIGAFDAILMDLHMPGLDGISAIHQIRAQETAEGRSPVPVLIVTADVMQEARDKADDAGAAGYLTKPLSKTAIVDALSKLNR